VDVVRSNIVRYSVIRAVFYLPGEYAECRDTWRHGWRDTDTAGLKDFTIIITSYYYRCYNGTLP